MTLLEFIVALHTGTQVAVGLMGNSVGAGYYATNASLIPTYGDEDVRITSYANQFRAYLQTLNNTSQLWNESVSGWATSNHITNGTVAILAGKTPKPDIVLIPLQINDCAGVERLEWAVYQANLRTLVEQCLSAGMTPILVKENAVNTVVVDAVRTDGKTYADFQAEQDVVASEYALDVWDFHAPTIDIGVTLYDNVHPSQAGHDILLTTLIDLLAPPTVSVLALAQYTANGWVPVTLWTLTSTGRQELQVGIRA